MATAMVDSPSFRGSSNSTRRRNAPAQLRDEFGEETRKIVTACIVGTRDDLTEYQQRIVDTVSERIHEDPQFFESTCEELNLTTTNFNARLMEVWEGMFSDNRCNWGRVTAFLAFCRYVCVYAQSHGLPSTVMDSVPPWATIFVGSHLRQWIESQGGWVRHDACNL